MTRRSAERDSVLWAPPAEDKEVVAALTPYVEARHLRTLSVLTLTLFAGRRLEAWLSRTLTELGLQTSEFNTLSILWLKGAPHRLTAGAIASRIVQTSGGTTKTIQRLQDRDLVRRVEDPSDGRRILVELTPKGMEMSRRSLTLVLDAFELEIGDLEEPDAGGIGVAIRQLNSELTRRLPS